MIKNISKSNVNYKKPDVKETKQNINKISNDLIDLLFPVADKNESGVTSGPFFDIFGNIDRNYRKREIDSIKAKKDEIVTLPFWEESKPTQTVILF